MTQNMRLLTGLMIAAVCAIGCTERRGVRQLDGDRGTLYPATCEDACAKEIDCGALSEDAWDACVLDCESEPWPHNYRECRATTCGLTEADCEQFGVLTCEQACENEVACGEITAADRDACVAECRREGWPGNYLDCRATHCGWTEAACERFTG